MSTSLAAPPQQEMPLDAIVVELTSLSDVAIAASMAQSMAITAGAQREEAGEVAASAAELASNAIRHAGGGTFTVRAAYSTCIISVTDRGPGDVAMLRRLVARTADPSRWLGGDCGVGLGVVTRLMNGLSFEARPGGGVAVRAWKLCSGTITTHAYSTPDVAGGSW